MMKPVYQTIFAPPKGNCMQASIASILELPLDDVPDFVAGDDWRKDYREFLLSHGLEVIVFSAQKWNPIGYHLISGKSLRGDWNHVIIGYRGKGVFDPNPDGNCDLLTVETFALFVCANPARYICRAGSAKVA